MGWKYSIKYITHSLNFSNTPDASAHLRQRPVQSQVILVPPGNNSWTHAWSPLSTCAAGWEGSKSGLQPTFVSCEEEKVTSCIFAVFSILYHLESWGISLTWIWLLIQLCAKKREPKTWIKVQLTSARKHVLTWLNQEADEVLTNSFSFCWIFEM